MEILNLNRHHLGFLISVEQESRGLPREVGWDSSKAYIAKSVSEPSGTDSGLKLEAQE